MYDKDYLVDKLEKKNLPKQASSIPAKKPENKVDLLLKELNLDMQKRMYEIEALGYEQMSAEKIKHELNCEKVRWYSVQDYPNIIPIDLIKKYTQAIVDNIFRYIYIAHPQPHTSKVMMVGQMNNNDNDCSIYFKIEEWRN